ncbi:MAG: ATP-dependent sacrificial sulfur transferase LarE [Bacteroidales bacterium]|nr:ATP-dependent sacrificial sulfur transferase LarE [Bacteroidales bacterium]
MNDKLHRLEEWMKAQGSVAVAFSGGVDSTFVLAVARKALGHKAMAFTVKTPYIPDWELEEAKQYCVANGIRQVILQEAILPELGSNPVNRCYLCKKHIFTRLRNEARNEGFACLVDGSNADDTGVYRPGLAALRELGINSPLLENGITKAEVRRYSAQMGLPTAEKPSYACLLTRIPYNTTIVTSELTRIEKAERYLASLGYANARVRHHGNLARIEAESSRIAQLADPLVSKQIIDYFHHIGYTFVTIDLEGYRSGSYDTALKNEHHEP